MKYDPIKYIRRSIRLKGYDYSSEGAYHVVVRSKNGECVFGDVRDGKMKRSPVGEIAEKCWRNIPEHFRNVELDQYVVMPNHIHGIIVITSLVRAIQSDNPSRKGFIYESPTRERNRSGKGFIHETPTKEHFSGWPSMKDPRITLGKVIRAFKAECTKMIHDAVCVEFGWQRNYYEHIIRDGKDLDRIRQYILDNPINWATDEDYPKNIRMDRTHDSPEE
jgi:putative transposase